MAVVGVILVAIGILIAYEAVKGGLNAPATASAAGGGSTSSTVSPNTSGVIPSSWLQALAAHESPSALQGNFQYGAFGLQCGAGQGVASGCTPPILGGAGDVASYDLFTSWDQAVSGLTAWVSKNAPGAFGASNCYQFMSSLQAGGYGGTSNWPAQVCAGVP